MRDPDRLLQSNELASEHRAMLATGRDVGPAPGVAVEVLSALKPYLTRAGHLPTAGARGWGLLAVPVGATAAAALLVGWLAGRQLPSNQVDPPRSSVQANQPTRATSLAASEFTPPDGVVRPSAETSTEGRPPIPEGEHACPTVERRGPAGHALRPEPTQGPSRPSPRFVEPSALATEGTELARARSELRAGRPSAALLLLRELAERYPGSELVQEREVLMVDALAGSGQGGAAIQRAQAFLGRFPESPHRESMRQTLLKLERPHGW